MKGLDEISPTVHRVVSVKHLLSVDYTGKIRLERDLGQLVEGQFGEFLSLLSFDVSGDNTARYPSDAATEASPSSFTP